jgi:hypothetical protein
VRPLRHRFEVVHRLTGFHFDHAFEAVAFVLGRQHEIREHLSRTDADASGLIVPDVDGDFVLTLEFRLQQANHAIVFELFSNRPNQYGTHATSGEPAMLAYSAA